MREMTFTIGRCLRRKIVHFGIRNSQRETIGEKKMIECRHRSPLISVYKRMVCYQRVEKYGSLFKDRRVDIASKW
jgi:hypothetical protein